ncbi:MAG: hypothetical protein ACKO5K_10810 [Armatimonadota bacterium]
MHWRWAVPAAAMVSTLTAGVAHAEDYLESGGPKHRVSIGSWAWDATDKGFRDQVKALGLEKTGGSLAYSYSFFRPTRHEAVATLQLTSRGQSGWPTETPTTLFQNRLSEAIRKPLALLSAEYRWRFGGFGKAYYGMGLGIGVGGVDAFGISSSSLGYEFTNKFFVELRSYTDSHDGMIGTFMLGTKF